MHKWAVLAVLVVGGCGDDGGSAITDGPPGGGGSADAPAGGPQEPANLSGMTAAHNAVRAMVQTSPALAPMVWNAELAATAAAWVAMCRDTDDNGLVDHNPNRSQGHPMYVGENIFAASGMATAQQAVSVWASEKPNYNYADNSCSGVCGHYTQIVWRDSIQLGCALGNCPNLTYKTAILCNYMPGGNNGGKPY